MPTLIRKGLGEESLQNRYPQFNSDFLRFNTKNCKLLWRKKSQSHWRQPWPSVLVPHHEQDSTYWVLGLFLGLLVYNWVFSQFPAVPPVGQSDAPVLPGLPDPLTTVAGEFTPPNPPPALSGSCNSSKAHPQGSFQPPRPFKHFLSQEPPLICENILPFTT